MKTMPDPQLAPPPSTSSGHSLEITQFLDGKSIKMLSTCSPRKLTVGSLFSGIGGFDLGMERAGFEIIWQCEIDKFCQRVLKKHWPDVRMYNDVKEINRSNAISPDVIVGGFPCQPFSNAGKRKGAADDRFLWPEMLGVIRELQPRWVIGENVAGFINMELENAFTDLETEGYKVEAFVLPANAVGAPHRRNRVWIMAYPQSDNDRRNGRGLAEAESKAQNDGAIVSVSGCGQVLPYPNGKGLAIRQSQRDNAQPQQPAIVGICGEPGEWWAVEPAVRRVVDGIPHRVDRLRGLGNAVVPQIAQHIGEMIIQVEALATPSTSSGQANGPAARGA